MVKKKKEETKVEEKDESFLVKLAIKKGWRALRERYSWMKESDFQKYIDMTELQDKIYDMYAHMEQLRVPEDKRKEYISREITYYITSGQVFNEQGQKTFSELAGLEKRAKGFLGFGARRKLGQKEYLGKVSGFGEEVNPEKYAGTPEIEKAVGTLKTTSHLRDLVEDLGRYGLISEKNYNQLQKGLYQKAIGAEKKFYSGMKEYLKAAVVFAVFGILLIALGSSATGAVVGSTGKFTSGIVGIVLIIFAIILFLASSRKRKNKEKIKN